MFGEWVQARPRRGWCVQGENEKQGGLGREGWPLLLGGAYSQE